VREYLDDPSSATLVEETEKIDQEFSRTALGVGCTH
jgi:hypothetical protein